MKNVFKITPTVEEIKADIEFKKEQLKAIVKDKEDKRKKLAENQVKVILKATVKRGKAHSFCDRLVCFIRKLEDILESGRQKRIDTIQEAKRKSLRNLTDEKWDNISEALDAQSLLESLGDK